MEKLRIVRCKKCKKRYRVLEPDKKSVYRCRTCKNAISVLPAVMEEHPSGRPVHIISVVSLKGGSAKTTTTVNLASTLGEGGKQILLIDLDPQAASTQWINVNHESRKLRDFFLGDIGLKFIISDTRFQGVHIIPASSWMMSIENIISRRASPQNILKSGLENLDKNPYDYIIIDSPPGFGIFTKNAMLAANTVLLPVVAHTLALYGLSEMMNIIETIRENYNRRLHVSGILPCRVDDSKKHSQSVVNSLRRVYRDLVFRTTIPENGFIAESPAYNLPVNYYRPNSTGAESFRLMARELLRKEQKQRELVNK